MPVGKAASRQGKKNLGQRKKRQQQAYRQRAVALAQGEQGRCHTHTGHAGVYAGLTGNQADQKTD
jgi:hypothetical protein